jgi:hypothetical protein|tara:strand:+ start:1761 stop:1871 length:111 start_codon:yes stop_codon:yes gene_type:complete
MRLSLRVPTWGDEPVEHGGDAAHEGDEITVITTATI